MQRLKIYIIILSIIIFRDLCLGQGGGIDLNNVSTAKLAKENTVDFRIKSSYQGLSREIITVSASQDTFNLVGGSTLADLEWSLRYGYKRWAEFSISGVTYFDQNQSSYKYGAGDTRIGLKLGTGKTNAGIDMAFDAYYTISTGFNDGSRLIRRFSANKNTWGGDGYADFNFNRFSVKVNAGYQDNGGRVSRFPDVFSAFWYPTISGTLGLTEQGEIIRSSQFNFGFGTDFRLLNWLNIFGEYKSNRIMSKESGGVNLGSGAIGLIFGNMEKLTAKLGYIMPFGENQTDTGIIFNLRFNGLFSEVRKRREVSIPIISEEQPAIVPGRKPFFSRGGVYFSGIRKPVSDTVFLIDISPSTTGNGLLEDKGANILSDLPDFIKTFIDTAVTGSNIAVVTFGSEASSLTWNSITEDKRLGINRSINDIPDNATEFVQSLENREFEGTVEDLAGGLDRAYNILESFERNDYNRIHIQRIIVFTDDIRDDSEEDVNVERRISRLVRRYDIKRDDFRYIYYLSINQEAGKRVHEYILNFVEKENGVVFREASFAERSELIPKMNFNDIAEKPIFQYLSQVTSIGVIGFNTTGKYSFGNQLTESFKSVFDFSEFFKITDQIEVDKVVQNFGLNTKEKIEIIEAQKVGKQLGVDYIATGEVVDFQMDREKGFYLPKLFCLPKTEMTLTVAVNLINVSDGALAYVDVISADYSFRRGLSLFPSSREDKTKYLSTLEKEILQNDLMQRWAGNLRLKMFEDISVAQSAAIP